MRPGMRIRTWQKVWLVAGGVCLAFVLLEGGLRFAGFIYLKVQEHQNQVALRHKDSVRILCIGESTTAVGGSDSYPRQLEDVLPKVPTLIFPIFPKFQYPSYFVPYV